MKVSSGMAVEEGGDGSFSFLGPACALKPQCQVLGMCLVDPSVALIYPPIPTPDVNLHPLSALDQSSPESEDGNSLRHPLSPLLLSQKPVPEERELLLLHGSIKHFFHLPWATGSSSV